MRGREASSVDGWAKRTCFGEGGVEGARFEWYALWEVFGIMMGLLEREDGMVTVCKACPGGKLDQ